MQVFNNTYVTLYHADARQLPIPDESIDCVVTSPPYWGLRDYGLGEWIGGNADCDHTISMPLKWNDPKRGTNYTRPEVAHRGGDASKCFLCDAQRVDSGIGLEPTPEEYCANMVAVFREVWRVLKPTGTVWLNLGDSYNAGRNGGWAGGLNGVSRPENAPSRSGVNAPNLKPKDLVGIPWRVAFALQADGWYLRSDIIWSKPNPMPESVQDRPTKAHEYMFLLTKSPRYCYDADAIQEPTGANKRSVWEITTQPYPDAHFATYPEKLVEPCIMAGCPLGGVVLDPFAGSGTPMAVAQRLGRKGVGNDLNTEYLALASKRMGSIALPMNLGM